jgi:hypothetical protein
MQKYEPGFRLNQFLFAFAFDTRYLRDTLSLALASGRHRQLGIIVLLGQDELDKNAAEVPFLVGSNSSY